MTQANPPRDDSRDTANILLKLEHLRNILISVSTGGKSIQEANVVEYQECYIRIVEELKARSIQNPVPYANLWDWYGKWSSGDLPTYRSRREYIRGLFEPVEKSLRESSFIPRQPAKVIVADHPYASHYGNREALVR